MIYSLVDVTKANSLNTYEYLDVRLTVIPTHIDDKSLTLSNRYSHSHLLSTRNALVRTKRLIFHGEGLISRIPIPTEMQGLIFDLYSCLRACNETVTMHITWV